MPDAGLYSSPILHEIANSAVISGRLQLTTAFSDEIQKVRFELHVLSSSFPSGNLEMTLTPKNFRSKQKLLGVIKTKNERRLKSDGKLAYWIIESYAKFNSSEISWWWPNGHGKSNLYNASVTWVDSSGTKHQIFRTFGFRTVQLVQSAMKDGDSFYFKINDIPVFMSGSNWIPSSSAVPYFSKFYRKNLESAKDAGIKMLRVWGGGIYERDEFYEIADELGIMIWQDFMFACSTYPNGTDFLNSVSSQIIYWNYICTT